MIAKKGLFDARFSLFGVTSRPPRWAYVKGYSMIADLRLATTLTTYIRAREARSEEPHVGSPTTTAASCSVISGRPTVCDCRTLFISLLCTNCVPLILSCMALSVPFPIFTQHARRYITLPSRESRTGHMQFLRAIATRQLRAAHVMQSEPQTATALKIFRRPLPSVLNDAALGLTSAASPRWRRLEGSLGGKTSGVGRRD